MTENTSTITVRPPVWALIAAVIIGGCFYLYGKNIELRAPVTAPVTIAVSADAKVSTKPDVAIVNFGIATGRKATAKAAIDSITSNMTKILAAVEKAGIEEKDITTESFWLSPSFDYTTSGQVPRGYEANQTLRVKIRDLDKVGDVLTAATSAGANQAGGVTFSIDNPDAAQAKAREMAIKKAQEKAEVLAESLGMSVGRLLGFTEGGGMNPPMPMMRTMEMDAKGGEAMNSLQLPAGEQDVTSYVTLTYEVR